MKTATGKRSLRHFLIIATIMLWESVARHKTIVPVTVCPGLVERTHLDVNGNQAEAEQKTDPAYPSSLLERRLQEEFGGHRRMAWKSRKAVSFS